MESKKKVWSRSSPAELFYKSDQLYSKDICIIHGTSNLSRLCDVFQDNLLNRGELMRSDRLKHEPSFSKKSKYYSSFNKIGATCSHGTNNKFKSKNNIYKKSAEHSFRLHQDLWFNDPGETNKGPVCRCSGNTKKSGIIHNVYAGENHLPLCNPNTNNADKLYHYRITLSATTNFVVPIPSTINHENHNYIFEGFSLFTHEKLNHIPLCKVTRFNLEYKIVYYEESFPQNFTVRELDLFHMYLFKEILELVDFDLKAAGDPEGCQRYHFMPRFVRELPHSGKEILSMSTVLKYLLKSAHPVIPKEDIKKIVFMPECDWNRFTRNIKGMIVTYPGMKPSSLRVDQLERNSKNDTEPKFPEIVHFGTKPHHLGVGNHKYQKAQRRFSKRSLQLANKSKLSVEDKLHLESKTVQHENWHTKKVLNRKFVVTVSSQHFIKTGIMSDVVQHALMLPALVSHLRYHKSLDVLEEKIHYTFRNRSLLELALTHPSYNNSYGTNSDHIRNTLSNCGTRNLVYGDPKIHKQMTIKRGMRELEKQISQFGKTKKTESLIKHNERLEFLGDSVVKFVATWHLFQVFPDLQEGALSTFISAITKNLHLAMLGKNMQLDEFLLSAHCSLLCNDIVHRHALANCFEALMGALYVDGGVEVADMVFSKALFDDSAELLDVWVDKYPHPLQQQEPFGDRHYIPRFPWLQNLTMFEELIGIQFVHIRLLAQAFTHRSKGYNNLTQGSNERLEFLGNAVIQLVTSEYLYKHFPQLHEGHLSILQSTLTNNRTLEVVSNDLGLAQHAQYSKAELYSKDRADLMEAFIGAVFVDQDFKTCQVLCNVSLISRLQDFITNQDWLDPKSKLQQFCQTFIYNGSNMKKTPVYQVIKTKGPSHNRLYTVGVFFNEKMLAKAEAGSIQQAEFLAANKVLSRCIITS